jgi:hypothetical protein
MQDEEHDFRSGESVDKVCNVKSETPGDKRSLIRVEIGYAAVLNSLTDRRVRSVYGFNWTYGDRWLTTKGNAANVIWYPLSIHTVLDVAKLSSSVMIGMAGKRAELLNASRDYASVNIGNKKIFLAADTLDRSGWTVSSVEGFL